MSSQHQGFIVTLVDGVQVTVPDDLGVITSFVLYEQQDWFEAELPFLRKLIQPGNFVVDIGASFGAYTLSLAKRVGPSGRVWAFEPNPNVSIFLEHSLKANRFDHAVLDRRGIADVKATMFFKNHRHSEGQGLSRTCEGTADFTVQTASLDQLMDEYGWEQVDFLKIDVEGFERQVLEGAQAFIDRYSPLVLYEVQQGDGTTDQELPKLFEARGLESYRLIPGLDLLIPAGSEQVLGPYTINVFGCNKRRAELLRPTGMLLSKQDLESEAADHIRESLREAPPTDVDKLVEKLPFSRALLGDWRRASNSEGSDMLKVLSLYEASRSVERSKLERWIALTEAKKLMKLLIDQRSTAQRFSTLARILLDIGERMEAVPMMTEAWQSLQNSKSDDFSEPFLPCGSRFDHVIPMGGWDTWIRASIIEGGERWGIFPAITTPLMPKIDSSIFINPATSPPTSPAVESCLAALSHPSKSIALARRHYSVLGLRSIDGKWDYVG